MNGIPDVSPNLALGGECLAEVNHILEQEELDFNNIRIGKSHLDLIDKSLEHFQIP